MFGKDLKKIIIFTLQLFIISILTFYFKELLAQQKEYPNKPITMIVGTAPGGVSDLGARVCSDALSKRLGVPIVILNKAGAGGNAALVDTLNAKPDGYTIVTANVGGVINQVLFPNAPYDLTKDFIPICAFSSVPKLAVVNSDSPFKTFEELLNYARKNPGKLNCSTPGTGTGSHLELELLKIKEKVDIVNVPFKSSTEANTALLGKHVDFTFASLSTVHGLLKAGRLRGLGIDTKSKEFPDIPMFSQKTVGSWQGFLAPIKIPKNVHKKLVEAFMETFKDPGMIQKVENIGFTPYLVGPDELAKVIKDGLREISEIVEKAGIRPGKE